MLKTDQEPQATALDRAGRVIPELPLRKCVGIMLLNRDGQIWLGRRRPRWIEDRAGHIWQMPQGGIAPGETPEAAALRELREETGVCSAEIVDEAGDWLTYELPAHLLGVALKGRYRGQRQKWFAMRFSGLDGEIDIRPRNGVKAEFEAWRWAPPHQALELAISFKRPVYEIVVREFAHLLAPADPLTA